MERLQSRIDSFSKTKRVKKGSSTTTLKWPHPTNAGSSSSSSFKATPATLAEAGFYYSPAADDIDNVTCFMCEKQLGGWEEDDDPFQIHFDKCKTKCSWALLRCGLREDVDRHGRFVFPDKSRHPGSKAMEKARLETFSAGDGWIHDQTRGHGANSKKMAKAGFIYTPQHQGDDLATCLYCNVSLSGWDEDDDPLEEHQKRKDKSGYPCPFFSSTSLPPSSTSSSAQAPPSSTSSTLTAKPSRIKPSSRSTKPPSSRVQQTQHEDTFMPTKTHDGDLNSNDDDADDASESGKSTKLKRSSRKSTTSRAPAKTPRKPSSQRSVSGSGPTSTRKASSAGAKTPAGRSLSRDSSRAALIDVAEEEDEEAEEVEEVVVEDVKKGKKGAKASTAKTPAKTSRVKASTATGTRGRSKAVALSESEADVATEDDDPEAEDPEPPVTVKKSSRATKSKASMAPSTSKTKEKITKARTRSKSIARSGQQSETKVDYEVQEDAQEDEPPKTVKKSRAKATKKIPAAEVVASDDLGSEMDLDDGEAWTTAPETERKSSRSTSKLKATNSTKKKEVETKEQDSDAGNYEPEEVDVQKTVKKSTAKGKGSSKAKPPSKAKAKVAKEVVDSETEEKELEKTPQLDEDAQKEEQETITVKKSTRSKPSAKSKGKAKATASKPLSSSSRHTNEETEEEDERQTDQDEVQEEDEFGPVIRQPTFTTSATKKAETAKAKPPSRANSKVKVTSQVEDDGHEQGKHKTTISEEKEKAKPTFKRPPVMMDGDGDIDMTPLFVPKRTTSKSGNIMEVEKEQEKQIKPKKQIKVVDVSSDDEEEPKEMSVRLVQVKNKTDSVPKGKKNEAASIPQTIEEDEDDPMNIDGQQEKDEAPSIEVDVPMHDDREANSLPAAFKPPKTPLRNQAPQIAQQLPSTSSLPQSPLSSSAIPEASSSHPPQSQISIQELEEEQATQGQAQDPEQPPFFPALSKLPFIPLPSLTPTELDMTVEEWVRYQMEMEYDKFKRDGERELVRFRKKAEDVRKVIEGL